MWKLSYRYAGQVVEPHAWYEELLSNRDQTNVFRIQNMVMGLIYEASANEAAEVNRLVYVSI